MATLLCPAQHDGGWGEGGGYAGTGVRKSDCGGKGWEGVGVGAGGGRGGWEL